MSLTTKVNGTWKEISSPKVKVSGVWKDATKVYAKANGYWKPVYEASGEFTGLKFTANTAGSTVKIEKRNSASWNIQYSTNNGATWSSYTPGSSPAITLSSIGSSVCFKGTPVTQNVNNYIYFSMSGIISASGNIMSLCSGDNFESATTIPINYCFNFLFKNCTSLISAPELPATTLTDACYMYMFQNCTSLIDCPELPSISLKSSAYDCMFYGCTSLIIPSQLLAATLKTGCYNQMFYGCSSLKVNNTGAKGTLFFTCPSTVPSGSVSYMFTGTGGSFVGTPVANGTYYYSTFEGLKLTANTANSTVTLSKTGSPSWAGYYSINSGATWISYIPGTTGAITLAKAGDSVCFKGTLSAAQTSGSYLQFSMTGSIAASGNIMSMCSGDNFESVTTIPYNYCFYSLFLNCASLTSVPELPATTLTNYCYNAMFYNCTGITATPTLPATTLTEGCYYNMFGRCTSLTTATTLSATTAKKYCYAGMFGYCTSLVTPPPSLTLTSIAYASYYAMFIGCSSLATPPIISASGCADISHYSMFDGCSSLKVSETAGTLFFTCPSSTASYYEPVTNMFSFTGGTFTGTPTRNKNYFYYFALTGLSVSGDWTNTQYTGQAVNTLGLTFTATYEDGSTKTVYPTSVSPSTWGSTAGVQTCTFTYTENGISKTCTKDANVQVPVVKYRVGGRIFYIDSTASGATYTFYDSSGNTLSTQTVAGLATAYEYSVVGTPSKDKFYAYNNISGVTNEFEWGAYSTTVGTTSDGIGTGKTNSATALATSACFTPRYKTNTTIWKYLRDTVNANNIGGCNDWYIGSMAEQTQLKSSGLVSWYSNYDLWSSTESSDRSSAYTWTSNSSRWEESWKELLDYVCTIRSF